MCQFDSDAGTDQVGAMWRLYRQHQRDGLMHMNVFGLNTVLIGDFDTLKQVFSLSETTNRLTGTGMEALGREDRRIKGKHHPGDSMQSVGALIVVLFKWIFTKMHVLRISSK